MKKIFVLVLILLLGIFVFTGCDGTSIPTEGEGEGEGEGEEEVSQVVLVESFSADGCGYCEPLKPVLEQIATEYSRDEVIIVNLIPWGSYLLQEARDRFDWYSLSGVPQTLFNGTNRTNSNSYNTINNTIKGHLNASPKVSIKATRTAEGNTSVLTGTVKNISNNTLSNLVINGMAFRKRGSFSRAVVDIFEEQKISIASLAAGESKSFTITLEDINWDGFNMDGVVFVQSVSGTKSILQAQFID
ncbi:hypothetical protein KO361_05135 [Candidatus Woesearchaeota archaeon]|jgi:thiol-disulfide isomerase/thioredoxin|nr:hypothetical protein [Candidatus Woesearchaeota archaeon]